MNILTILLSLQYIKKSPINTSQIEDLICLQDLSILSFILEISVTNLFVFYTIPCAVIASAQGCTVQAISRLFCRSRVTIYCQSIQFISLYLTVSLVHQDIIWYVNNKVGLSHNTEQLY